MNCDQLNDDVKEFQQLAVAFCDPKQHKRKDIASKESSFWVKSEKFTLKLYRMSQNKCKKTFIYFIR